jgi:CRP/FNR family cyclic AMP-dependent transcriptional regulator
VKPTLTTIEKALFLKELEFFGNVTIEQAAAVAAIAVEVEFEPGDIIFKQDEPAQHIYLVIEGNAIAEKNGIVITVFSAGRGFGDLSLMEDARYSITVTAAEHLHCLRFSVDEFVETMLEHPEIAVGVVRALALRLAELGEQMAQLSRQLQDGSGTFRIPDRLRESTG